MEMFTSCFYLYAEKQVGKSDVTLVINVICDEALPEVLAHRYSAL
jgi:hypothetical protein